MNGPTKMYVTKPIVRHDLPVDIPDCMYKIKSFHSSVRNGTAAVITDRSHVATANKNLDTFDQNRRELPEMAALVIRQEHILVQLADLKNQMLNLKDSLRVSTPSLATTTRTQQCCLKLEEIPDVVINVDPEYPPYYLQILQLIWSNNIYLKVKCHLHSTIAELNENATSLQTTLESFVPKLKPHITVNVRLIWKDVCSQTELIIGRVPILGEVNILRYLARATASLNYETTNPQELDVVLDICYLLVRSRTKTERSGFLQSLNKKLNKEPWLCRRNEISIADVAMYSALKKIPSNEINVNMTKWLQKCENIIL